MSKSESRIDSEIFLELGKKPDITLFRNHVAHGVTGQIAKFDADEAVVKFPTRAQFGLCKGSSDRVGWRSIKITPDMVGTTVAVFTAIEVKSEKWSPPKQTNTKAFEHHQAQQNFITRVIEAGGFAGFAQNVDDALYIVGGHLGL